MLAYLKSLPTRLDQSDYAWLTLFALVILLALLLAWRIVQLLPLALLHGLATVVLAGLLLFGLVMVSSYGFEALRIGRRRPS